MILRIYTSSVSGQAKRYYIQKPTKEAYYSEGQEFTGYWGGKAATLFGLKGRVDEQSFNRLCDNQDPGTGEQLTERMKSNRRVGEDYNWNFPKSVSLVYAYTKDERILQAARQAVRDTMEEMEQMVSTRVRKAGVKDGDRLTKNWVYGEFVHVTARPVGGIPDPHLHIHCFVPNVTLDSVEKKWKAIQFGKIHDNADYFDAAVTLRLATNLKELGLQIVTTKDAFEIAGISREIIEEFSRRTKQINEEAERRGTTDAKEKAGLAALTRENKSKTVLIPELEKIWWQHLPPEHRKAFEAVKTLLQRTRAADMSQQMAGGPVAKKERVKIEPGETSDLLGTKKKLGPDVGAGAKRESVNKRTRPKEPVIRDVEANDDDRRAVALAALHIFERASVVTERQLIAEARNHWRYGEASLEGVWKAVKEADFLRYEIDGVFHLTTEEVRAEERRIIGGCRNGIGQFEPMNPRWKIEDEKLNKQQREAVAHVVNSRDWIVGISGKAGTGKTTLLHEAKRGIEAGLNKLLVFAPTSEAARDVLRKEGFPEAETVARLLENEIFQDGARDAVWWVDEAGLLSNEQMDRLEALAKKLGSRLVLVGDTGQHHSVQRGQAFDLLEKHADMKVAHVEEIMRQRGAYKRFVERVAKHDFDEAFQTLDNMDSIHEAPTTELAKLAAEKYIEALKLGETVQATCPTHKECDQVTEAIREALKAEKKIRKGVKWDVLKNENWSKAEKMDHHRYERGQVVQINRHVKGFALGEQLEVIGVRDGLVRVRSKSRTHDAIKALPLEKAKRFCVYQPETIEICEGETMRVTCNGRNAEGHRLDNGKEYVVDYISPDGKIVLKNGWRVDKTFKHFDYGYCPTSHGIQGKTIDRVIVVQSAMLTAAADANQFYVSASRGRKGVDVITDDKEILCENVSRVRSRMMATEMEQKAAEEDTKIEEDLARSSDKLGRQKKNRAVKKEGLGKENGKAIDSEISELLGRVKAQKLTAKAAAELERIEREQEETELERKHEMVMGM
jgi:conjugative relaxase-like TrwC/TraI family protein